MTIPKGALMFRKTYALVVLAAIFAATPVAAFSKTKLLSRKELRLRRQNDIRVLRDPEYCYVQAGLPHYTGLFGRDSLIISWQLIDYDPSIARCTLSILARFQGKKFNAKSEEEPGKILHEWHKSSEDYERIWPFPYYGSADSTPLFIYVSGLYFEKTGDAKWLRSMWPNIERALSWCKTDGAIRGDMFIAYERKNPKGLFHQGWKDSDENHLRLTPPVAIVEIQGYYYAALVGASKMAAALGKPDRARELSAQAMLLKEAFMKTFWLPGKQWFAFALDENGADARVASNQGQLLFTGILDDEPERAATLVRRLFLPDLWTPFGIRTLSSEASDYDPLSYHQGSVWPHDNWIIAQGLKRLGFTKEYGRVKNAQISASRIFHGRIPELYFVVNGILREDPEACRIQGWASGGLLNFLTPGN